MNNKNINYSNKLFLIEMVNEISLGEKDDSELADMALEKIMNSLNIEDFYNISFFDDNKIIINLSKLKADTVTNILSEYLIETTTKEINIKYINKYLTNINDYKTEEIINRYRKSNTSIDDVLDKICVQGIESLDDIDLEILNN